MTTALTASITWVRTDEGPKVSIELRREIDGEEVEGTLLPEHFLILRKLSEIARPFGRESTSRGRVSEAGPTSSPG